MTKCACCEVEHDESDLFNSESFLDFKLFKRCGPCADNRAETEHVVTAVLEKREKISKEVLEAVRVYFRGDYLTIDAWKTRQLEPEPELIDFLCSDETRQLRWILDASLDMRRERDLRAAEKPERQSRLCNIVRKLRLRFYRTASAGTGAAA